MKVKVLGIVGTPIRNGNCQYIVEVALKAAEETEGVETELIHLSDYNIKYCVGCDKCMRTVAKKQKELGMIWADWAPVPVEGYTCSIKDDMQILHEKMVEADGFIIGAPVYMVSVPGQLKTFVDRCRTFAHDLRLIGKVLGAVTVGYFRHAGEENTIHTINNFGYTMFMNVVAEGASTISTKEGTGVPIKDPKIAVKEDTYGLYWVRQMGIRVGHMAKIVKAGREITGLV